MFCLPNGKIIEFGNSLYYNNILIASANNSSRVNFFSAKATTVFAQGSVTPFITLPHAYQSIYFLYTDFSQSYNSSDTANITFDATGQTNFLYITKYAHFHIMFNVNNTWVCMSTLSEDVFSNNIDNSLDVQLYWMQDSGSTHQLTYCIYGFQCI